jgi:flagellar capping protein FliD
MSVSVRGISSGVDINGIIEELMQLERQPIRRHEAQIERNEQIAELWREVNSRLDTLKRTLPPLLQELTFTAPVPTSSNENALTAKISGMPVEGSYRLNVTKMATYHSVASKPPTVGDRIANPSAARNLNGTFYLGTGRSSTGLQNLTFDSVSTENWLRGSFGAGFQAVVDENAGTVYAINPSDVAFSITDEYADAEEIHVYLDSFLDSAGQEALADLQAYLTLNGWDVINPDAPLFTIREDSPGSGNWQTYNQQGGSPFAFLGDHPLGTFELSAHVVDDSDETLAINSFDFQIRNSVDESGFVTIEDTDSLLDIADKINAKAYQTGVIASIVQANADDYRLVLESAYEGSEGFIHAYDYAPLSGDESTYGEDSVLADLFILEGSGNTATPEYLFETEAAQDAEFTLNGLPMTRSTNIFTDVISGLEITLTGIGQSTLKVSPDLDSAVEEVSLFVEAVNEVNSYLRILQESEKGPLQGNSDLMRIERQLRTLIHGIVSDVAGSVHNSQLLRYAQGATGTDAIAAATGQYTGTANSIELIYNTASGTWRYQGQTFTSGDTIDGVKITLGSGNPSNLSTLTLQVSPPTTPLTYYNTPGSSHSNQDMVMSGSGTASAKASGTYTGRASQIQLLYSSSAASWLYNGNPYNSGDTIDGIIINLGSGTPANFDTLTLNVTAPSDPRSFNSMAAIGVMASDKEGFLEVDRAKLRAALANDAQSVYRLFSRAAPTDPAGFARGPAGLALQMDSFSSKMIGSNGLVRNRQSQLDRLNTQYRERIEALERRMEMREARLVRQFTFMEQYIARIQEQTGLMASFETMMSAQQSE